MNTDNKLPTIRCNYCKRIAYWVYPSTGVQTCSSCKDLIDRGQWTDLALRWVTDRPKDWVSDVAAFLEATAMNTKAPMERLVPVSVCEGCNGSKCGSDPHQWRKVLPTLGVIAQITRGKGANPDA